MKTSRRLPIGLGLLFLLSSVAARAEFYEANGWRIEKTVQSSTPTSTTYYINLERTGPDAGVVTITDNRDSVSTTEYGPDPYPPPVSGGGGARTIVWTQDMPQGASTYAYLSTITTPDLPPGSRIVNRATVTDSNGTTSVIQTSWVDRDNDTTRAHGSTGQKTDPVNTGTGEYYLEPITDFDLGGPLPLRFTRGYAAKLDDPGVELIHSALGPDWMHNFDVQLVRQDPAAADRSFFVILEGGKVIPFTEMEDGTWILNLVEPFTTYSLKSDGDDLWFCDPSQELLYRFDNADRSGVKEIADRNGNSLLIGRRADGLATNATDGLGRELVFTYNASSNLVQVGDGTRTVSFGYGAQGELVAATNALGQATAYAYDPTNSFTNGNGALMASIQYPRGNTPMVQAYNTNGQVVAQTDADGAAMTFEYGIDGFTTFTVVTDPDGSLSRDEYDDKGALFRAYNARSNYFQYGFAQSRDNLTWLQDRRGNASRAYIEYDSRRVYLTVNRMSYGTRYSHTTNSQTFTNRAAPARTVAFTFIDLLVITNADTSTQWFHRDARGNVTGQVDRAGAAWATTFNGHGQPLTIAHPGGGMETLTYNADGTLASASDSDVGATTYAYDALRRLVGIQRPDGSSEGWGFDALDRVTAFTNAAGGVTLFEYDANGIPVRTTDPLGYELAEQTDLMDRPTNQTDSVGPRMISTYDNMGRRASTADPAGTNLYRYDNRGWVTNLVRGGRTWTWDYDFDGSVINAYSPSGNRTYIPRNQLGNPLRTVNALGETNAYSYNGMAQVTRLRNPLNKDTYFGYDTAGRLVAITNAVGDSSTFEYDGAGNRTRQTDFDGNATTFGYTPMGRLAVLTNALGEATRFDYDSSGRPVRSEHAAGTQTTTAYDAAGRVASVVDEGTNTWRFAYDARGAVVAATNPAGGATSYSYNLDGTLQTLRDSDTGAISNRYDAARRLVETVLPDGSSFQYEYNEHGEVVAQTDALGRRTQFGYDLDGQLVSLTDPDTNVATFAYDAAGRLTNATDRTGGATGYQYNRDGTLLAVTDPTGVRTDFVRDDLGRITFMRTGSAYGYSQFKYDRSGTLTNRTTPIGWSTAFVPDALHRIASVVNHLKETNAVARDARGRVTAATDPAGRVTQATYDPRGLPATIVLPDSNAVAYAWNPLGKLSRLTDFNGAAWNFSYTPMGRLQSVADPLSRATQYAYDLRGQLADVTFPDSGTATLTRDANGALVRAQCSGGPDLQFQRDVHGRITNANDVALARDAEGRIVAADDDGTAFGATYDAAGRLATVPYANGAFTVTYTYDVGATGDGQLTRVSDDLTGTQIDFGYDADHRLQTLTLPNGEIITYSWDPANRLTRLQSGDYVDIALTYDLSGRVTETDVIAPLTPSGNVETAIASLTYDAASQISSPGYAHDARGRVTATPERTFAWDGASRLTGIDGATLTYDGLGHLRTRADGADTNRFFCHPAIGGAPIVAERDETTGQMLRYYVWTPGGRLLYMIDAENGNAVSFYHFDQVGSTLALTDTNAALTDAYAYDPYGRILDRTGTNPQPFTFTGAWGVRQEDADGTLYHMRARYYDATLGRFLSPEPLWPQLARPKALNPYQYAGGDPIRFADPSGRIFGVPPLIGLIATEEAAEAMLMDAVNVFVDAYEAGGAIGFAIELKRQGIWDIINPEQFNGLVADMQALLRLRLQEKKRKLEPQPPPLPCHAQPKNTAPQSPPDLGQRHLENLGRSPALSDQLTPYQPGGTPILPRTPASLTGYTATDIVGGLFDPIVAWDSGIRYPSPRGLQPATPRYVISDFAKIPPSAPPPGPKSITDYGADDIVGGLFDPAAFENVPILPSSPANPLPFVPGPGADDRQSVGPLFDEANYWGPADRDTPMVAAPNAMDLSRQATDALHQAAEHLQAGRFDDARRMNDRARELQENARYWFSKDSLSSIFTTPR